MCIIQLHIIYTSEQYQYTKNTNRFSQLRSEEVVFSLVVTRILHSLYKPNVTGDLMCHQKLTGSRNSLLQKNFIL